MGRQARGRAILLLRCIAEDVIVILVDVGLVLTGHGGEEGVVGLFASLKLHASLEAPCLSHGEQRSVPILLEQSSESGVHGGVRLFVVMERTGLVVVGGLVPAVAL